MSYTNGKATDYQMADSHEGRIQRLEETHQETVREVAEYGVKIDALGEKLGTRLDVLSERLIEKIDTAAEKVDKLSPLSHRVDELEKAEAKRVENASLVKKGFIGVLFTAIGVLGKTAFSWISNLF